MRLINILFLYILIPALIVLLCVNSGSWFYIFGLFFYAIVVIISQFRLWILLPIPLGFSFWYWYTYGMELTDYVFVYTACLLLGLMLSEGSKQLSAFVKKTLPEQMNNIDYNEKVDELNRRLEKYKSDHPNEKLTPEIVEKIRTDIFFQ